MLFCLHVHITSATVVSFMVQLPIRYLMKQLQENRYNRNRARNKYKGSCLLLVGLTFMNTKNKILGFLTQYTNFLF